MKITPPKGSKISVETNDSGESVIIVPVVENPGRYFIGIFTLVWLSFWYVGETFVASEILSGNATGALIFWFIGWTMGGVFAASTAYRSLRPILPESLRLLRSGIDFDSGVRPLQWIGRNITFPKRVRCEINLRQLRSLRLRESEPSLFQEPDRSIRLTVEVDNQRIEIARDATEIEREWLARVLADQYGLSQGLAAADAPIAAE